MAEPIMWAPMGLLYTAVALYFAQVLLSRPTGTVQIAAFRSRRTQGRGRIVLSLVLGGVAFISLLLAIARSEDVSRASATSEPPTAVRAHERFQLLS
jgi:hypothetical protein